MPDIETDDYEFVCVPYDKPKECKVYRKFHLDKIIGRVVVNHDNTYRVYSLPSTLVKKALQYLGDEKEKKENA